MPEYSCTECDSMFCKAEDLASHLAFVHRKIKNKCIICSRQFQQWSELSIHLKAHSEAAEINNILKLWDAMGMSRTLDVSYMPDIGPPRICFDLYDNEGQKHSAILHL